jgi:hypothetical protein
VRPREYKKKGKGRIAFFPFVPLPLCPFLLCSRYPRPMNGILVAMIVMNCTFVSNGRLAI